VDKERWGAGEPAWLAGNTSLDCGYVTPNTSVRVFALIATLVVAGQILRLHLGVAPSVDAVREWADALGWRAPAAFLGLVIVRQLILLPAVVLLTAGGVIFGVLLGTVIGGTGIIVSGLANFALARRLGAAMVPSGWRSTLVRLTARGPAPVLIFTGLATMHPVGPLVAAHWAAGCSTIAASTFFLVIVPASYARAAALATFGSTLSEWGSPASLLLAAGLVAAVVVPLSVPTLRRRVFDPAPRD
jgi:uncharacterized membrane protein YdjX (TVP38/TMEM64 family)